MMREVVRNVQNARKQAELSVDDHIRLSLSTTDEELRKAIEEHLTTIAAETLADEVVFDQSFDHESSCSVEDAPLTIALEKK
jgi:isoleucyl-tRNA synthetase